MMALPMESMRFAEELTLGRISESSQGIRLVRLHSDQHALVQHHLDPHSESDD